MHTDAELDHLSALLAALPVSNELSIDQELPMDLSRNCAAPLTTYRVAKEKRDGIAIHA